MREDTYIERCRQQISTKVQRRRNVQLHKRRRKRNIEGAALETDRPFEAVGDDADDAEETQDTWETVSLLIPTRAECQWEKEFKTDIEPYARALCLKLANAILVALPRDIRDRVYSYVLTSDSTKVTICDGKRPRHLRSNCTHASVQSYDSIWKISTPEHYLDAAYVGKKMAREMAEAYYKTKTFYFDYYELYLLHKFLIVDRFGYGLAPADLVQNIEVVLDTSSGCRCHSTALFYYGLTPEGELTPEEAIRFSLEQLFLLRTRSAHIRFIVYPHPGIPSFRRRTEILPTILPFVCRLKELGFRVSFMLYTVYDGERIIEDSAANPIEQTLRDTMEVGLFREN